MFRYSYSAVIHGMETRTIHVEADVSEGLPMFALVGYLSSEAKEAKDRVKISIKNSGYYIPTKRITINLSPADIKKDGTAFDLPIAIAVLSAFGYIPQEALKKVLLVGELSLDGSINPVVGVLPIVYAARKNGFRSCIVPKENVKEGAVVQDIAVIGASHLKEVVEHLNRTKEIATTKIEIEALSKEQFRKFEYDFSEVLGQEAVKRALEVAAAGMHNVLMVGPPGAGKTMLAKRVSSIMPDLTFEEGLEISKIYSIAGLLSNDHSFIFERPFRAPHHSITATALVGGGNVPKPGEISLANGGVLFLDELPEFHRNTIELLRQPLEERTVTITRLSGNYQYPTSFMMVCAMNPCHCGYYPDRNRCSCTSNQIKRYLGKVSTPFLDRIDICTEAVEINYKMLDGKRVEESSEIIRKRVMKARERQLYRYKEEHFYFNAELSAKHMKKYCILGNEEKELLEEIFVKMNLSARAYHRILKVARTIADLDESEQIKIVHLSEAISYRSIDEKYWN